MKILIADKLSATAVKELESAGLGVVMNPELTADRLPAEIGPYDILVVRSTKVLRETIEAGKNLSLIIRAGAGVNTIDLEAASELGIHVTNCPGKNTAAVAELAMGLLIASDRRIADCTADLRAGIWNKKLYSKAAGLRGRTLAVIGIGSIGRAVAERARAFGMNINAWSRSLTPEKAEAIGAVYCESPADAVRDADAVSVHLAASADTKHFIGTELLSEMKDGAIVINTSRGEIIDTEALLEAVKTKGIRPALDVYENEPAAGDKAFPHADLASVITGTHHIGASTEEAAEAIAGEVVRIIKVYRESGNPPNVVNLRGRVEDEVSLVVRHFNHVGVLAFVLDELRNAGINIEEMQNSIFGGGKAAVCTMKLDSEPSGDLMSKLSGGKDIINISVK